MFKIEKDNADLAGFGFGCSYERSQVVLCSPAIMYTPNFIFSRYPAETTRIWNLFNLLTPTAWFWTIVSICLSASVLKFFTYAGTHLGIDTGSEEITLFPFT